MAADLNYNNITEKDINIDHIDKSLKGVIYIIHYILYSTINNS